MLPRVSLIEGTDVNYLLFSTPDAISHTIFLNGSWAPLLLQISKLFYDGIDKPFIMDIGANLGAYCLPIAKDIADKEGFIYAYEPQRIIYYQLSGNIFLNQLENIYAFNIAMGDSNEKITLPKINYNESINIGGFSLDQKIMDEVKPCSIIANQFEPEIDLITLNNYEVPKSPCLIKMDVEGFEPKILNGAREFLAKHNYPPMLLEVWNKEELLSLLDEIGYDYFLIHNEVIAQHPNYPRYIKFINDPEKGILTQRIR